MKCKCKKELSIENHVFKKDHTYYYNVIFKGYRVSIAKTHFRFTENKFNEYFNVIKQ